MEEFLKSAFCVSDFIYYFSLKFFGLIFKPCMENNYEQVS